LVVTDMANKLLSLSLSLSLPLSTYYLLALTTPLA